MPSRRSSHDDPCKGRESACTNQLIASANGLEAASPNAAGRHVMAQLHDPFAPFSNEKGYELPSSQWEQLEEGHHVIVQRDGEPLVAGKVDARAQDASVFWVWLDGGRGRIAVYADEGTYVWVPRGYCLECHGTCT